MPLVLSRRIIFFSVHLPATTSCARSAASATRTRRQLRHTSFLHALCRARSSATWLIIVAIVATIGASDGSTRLTTLRSWSMCSRSVESQQHPRLRLLLRLTRTTRMYHSRTACIFSNPHQRPHAVPRSRSATLRQLSRHHASCRLPHHLARPKRRPPHRNTPPPRDPAAPNHHV